MSERTNVKVVINSDGGEIPIGTYIYMAIDHQIKKNKRRQRLKPRPPVTYIPKKKAKPSKFWFPRHLWD